MGSVLFGGRKAKRLIPGHGSSIVPGLHEASLEDAHVRVTDMECVRGCRRLAAKEAILVGGSSGAIVAAVEKVKAEIPRGSACVLIFPDRGERYLDTIYCDAWVRKHFGAPSLREDAMVPDEPAELSVAICQAGGN